jgi:hypothetical protein
VNQPSDQLRYYSGIDENSAPYIPLDLAPEAFHCPRCTCDAYHYLAQKDMGRELTCSQCGLVLTIGKRPEEEPSGVMPSMEPEQPSVVAPRRFPPYWIVLLVLMGLIVGFIIGTAVRVV